MSRPEWEEGFQFEVLHEHTSSNSRIGRLKTPHGVIQTPAFMPVGTYGAVKGIAPDELKAAGAQMVLANALHLEFRPGSQTVQDLGGLHHLMGWQGPILTDSGGFQTFSLAALIKPRSGRSRAKNLAQDDDGLEIQSPVDGSRHRINPEKVIAIQRRLGCDFMMPLDVCPGLEERPRKASGHRFAEDLTQQEDPTHHETPVAEALETTIRWAARSRQAYDQSEPLLGKPQALFGILQGGVSEELRRRAADALMEIGFFGYALGGLAVGEAAEDRWRTVELCDRLLPRNKPRYLMGVGTPEDLRRAVSLGMDLFDCVLPTRNGRKGSLFTSGGKINLRNAKFKDDPQPIEVGCRCPACEIQADGRPRFSRGAIRHFLAGSETLGSRLGALHNLTYYFRVMEELRREIAAQKR